MLVSTVILSISVSAVEGAYTDYKVSGTDSKDFAAIVNNKGNNPYQWVWAASPFFRGKIVHRSVLHNSEHNTRSDYLLTYEGTTHQVATNAELYYYYHLNVRRQYDSDDYAVISGTWGWIY